MEFQQNSSTYFIRQCLYFKEKKEKKKFCLKGSFRLIIYKKNSQLSTFCASCSAEQIFKHWVLTERRRDRAKTCQCNKRKVELTLLPNKQSVLKKHCSLCSAKSFPIHRPHLIECILLLDFNHRRLKIIPLLMRFISDAFILLQCAL